MSDKGSFTSGFLAGAIVGGVVGGVIGSLLASRPKNNTLEDDEDDEILLESGEDLTFKSSKTKGLSRSLDDQINQLNLAIDDLRQQQRQTVIDHSLDED